MLTRQQNSKSILGLQRQKNERKFGQDITNYYNIQTNSKTYQKPTLCFSFIAPSKINHNSELTNKFPFCVSQPQVEVQIVMSNGFRNPIEDHYQDIMFYTLNQTLTCSIQKDFLNCQSQINEQMRNTLIIWMIKLQRQLKLQQSTLCLAVYLTDRYCSQQIILKNKFQLLGITCLFLSAKYEELITPRVNRFIGACQGLYSLSDIIQMESEVLECIAFNINKIVVLRSILFNKVDEVFRTKKEKNSKEIDEETDEMPIQQRKVIHRCEYFLQLILIEYKLNLLPYHQFSAVLLYMSCKMQNIQSINSKFVIQKYNIPEKTFKDYFQLFIQIIKKKNEYKFKEVNKKYQNLKNCDF